MNIDFGYLTEVEENKCLLFLHEEATDFLLSHKWCKTVVNGWYDKKFSIYEKLGVFLFEIEPNGTLPDTFVWVIVGDIPSAYIDQTVKTSKDALTIYCELMNDWSDHILQGLSLSDCYPVDAEATEENAKLLNNKIDFIRKELLVEST